MAPRMPLVAQCEPAQWQQQHNGAECKAMQCEAMQRNALDGWIDECLVRQPTTKEFPLKCNSQLRRRPAENREQKGGFAIAIRITTATTTSTSTSGTKTTHRMQTQCQWQQPVVCWLCEPNLVAWPRSQPSNQPAERNHVWPS